MKIVQRCVSALSVLAWFCTGGVAQATTYYVATNGSDGRTCSQSQSISAPKRTLNSAVTCLRAGDTLYVRSGTYDESLVATVPSGTSWSNPVVVAAYPGESVTMRPSAAAYVLEFAGSSSAGSSGSQQYIEFDGINLDGTNVSYDVVKIEAGPGYNAHHIRIKNATLTAAALYPGHPDSQVVLITGLAANAIGFNEFQHLTLTGGGPVQLGDEFSAMFYIQTPDNLIEDCIIENGVGAGVEIYNGNSPGSAPDRTIVRNTIIRNFTTSTNTRAYGIIAARGTGHQLYNNLIYNIANTAGRSGGIYVYNSANTDVYNNTVYANALYGILVETYSSGTAVRNNISYGNGVGDYLNYGSGTSESNNLLTNPRFVNAGGGDFRLQSSSPAIDAGAYLSLVTSDQLGVSRPQGNGYDIGAFEHDSGGGTTPPPSQPPPTGGSGASTDGTRVPNSSSIVDSSSAVWTLGPNFEILRNGSQASGGYGFQILWYQGTIFCQGDDYNWWRWTGSGWQFYSSADPNGGATASNIESGNGSLATSPSGTKVPNVASLVDSSLNVWTLGSGQQILRNGSQVGQSYGSAILWAQSAIYVLGDDNNWWQWTGSTYALYGSRAPA
jgi:hypothetical protein